MQNGKSIDPLSFNQPGRRSIAEHAAGFKTFSQLLQYFGIPDKGRYNELLQQEVLLRGIKDVPFGHERKAAFEEIERLKMKRASDGLLLGAAALKIMLQRVVDEGRGKWPDKWQPLDYSVWL